MLIPDSSIVYAAAMIVLGAIASALASLSKARKDSHVFGVIDFVISLGISIFSGVMFGLAASYFTLDSKVIYGSAGAGAYLGIGGLNKLTDIALQFVAQRANVKIPSDKDDE